MENFVLHRIGSAAVFCSFVTSLAVAADAAWVAEGNLPSADFGASIASAGDVNGDGFSDVLVGAPNFTNGENFEGRAFLYLGSASGLALAPTWTTEGNSVNAHFGNSVAGAGDVNGDGFSDVIVGANSFGNGQSFEGRAFVYHGTATGLSLTPAWTAESDQAFAFFGASVASAGDVNGDGFADVIVGADHFGNGQTGEGRALVYLGSASGLALTPAWFAESDQANANFGMSVASAGDLNGDGFSDVLVATPSFAGGQPYEGSAFAYLGSASGLALTPAWTAEGNQNGASFGESVASAGDVNDDGYADVVVGATAFDNGEQNEGRAFVYHGSAAGLALLPAWTAESNQANSAFGRSTASTGDVNGDGYSDVIVGAPSFSNGETSEGRAFSYLGSANGLGLTPAWFAESNQGSAFFGKSVASAGDVNADGFSDVLVGAPGFTNGESKEGRASLYLGAPPTFVPGDRLHASFTTPQDHTAAVFDGVAGTKLGLTFLKTAGSMKTRLQLIASDGSVAKQFTVKLGDKQVKKTLTLPASDTYTLRWSFLSGSLGVVHVNTNPTFPSGALSKSLTLKPKKGQATTALPLLALPSALLDVTLAKQKFVGGISISLTRPDDTTYDVSAYQMTALDGTVTLSGVPCGLLGAYTLHVSGYANDKETVKAQVTLHQPAVGNADVFLP